MIFPLYIKAHCVLLSQSLFKRMPGDVIILFPVALVKGRSVLDGLFPGAAGQGVVGDGS